MKQLLKKPNLRIKRPNKKEAIFILAVLFVLGIGTGFYYWQNRLASVDCTKLANNSNELLKQKKYKEAYSMLKTKNTSCSDVKSAKDKNNKDDPAGVAQFNASLAKSAYLSGDKAQAASYAEKFIDLNNKTLNDDQRKQIPNQLNEMYSMYDIKYNNYEYKNSN
jgi:uncharacterized protein HemX